MVKKLLAVAIILLFIGMGIIPSVISNQTSTVDIITVDDEGDGDYISIKEAIANANPGDTIEVYSGTYYEHDITIETEEITLKGISHELGTGNDTGKPFINGQGKAKVIIVKAEGVTITGFHIENGGGTYAYSIISISDVAHNCKISDNDISHSIMCCICCGSSDNKILNNNISHNVMRQGIVLGDGSRDNIISGNTISDMHLAGIDVWDSHCNIITDNTISRCRTGIDIVGSCNIARHNHIEDNDWGLEIWDNSIFNIVMQNNFINNSHNAYCQLGLGFYPAFLNRWINNYWDNWIGIGPKIIPGTILIFIPRPNFDWCPAQKPYDIGV